LEDCLIHRSKDNSAEYAKPAGRPKFTGTWRTEIEHDGDLYTYKLVYFVHNRDVTIEGRGETKLVGTAHTLEDAFYDVRAELSNYITEELF